MIMGTFTWDLESVISTLMSASKKLLRLCQSVSVLFKFSYPALASHAAAPGHLPHIHALQLYELHTTATCYLLVEICFIVQFGSGWQAAICKLYVLYDIMCMELLLLCEHKPDVMVSQLGYLTTSREHEIRVCESLFLFYTVFCRSVLRSLSSFPRFLSGLFPSLLSSLHPSFCPEGRERFKLWTKDTRRKTLQKTFEVCLPPSSVLRNVIHTQGTVSKEAESSWLKPDNAHGSLQLLQILVLLLWLFVLLLPLGPSRVFVYLRSALRSCQKMRAGLPFWPQVNSQLTKVCH